ncbi:hypothetical protein KPSA3_00948 [Pseudomonas syringae pv. actinidiae]|uniref:Uncharacterized protein n=1 Tax=Pseudomonas syringae pv. actinidiae TaxID=103796 RepID=A0AAN4TIU3_PSESF|nr:hypothetical protein KPSA3_00948 [Pseudomonas syringae pv. actinidiae]
MEGTKWATLTCSLENSAPRYSGSLCPSGLAINNVAPYMSGQNTSHTETSNVSGVFCTTTSLACKGKTFCIHARRFSNASWVFITPLGRPVEPEVKIT